MSKKKEHRYRRQSDFRISLRGVRRTKPDYSRIVQASLDHYLARREQDAAQQQRPRHPQGGGDATA